MKLLLWDKSRKIGSENLMVEFELNSHHRLYPLMLCDVICDV